MELSILLSLLGGLALFLYGMHMMSEGLELAAGDKMQSILEKVTANRFIGVLVGAAITAIIQSSSATTVMAVGFVNAGLMKLDRAVWIIMGANVGTTITGQLIALDLGVIAPLLAIVGVVMVTFMSNQKVKSIGEIIGGLGILLIGMAMMSDAMAPLRDNEQFVSMMTNFTNPVYGILAGALFTAIIQSSSASIGILQALAVSGAIPFEAAIFVLFGQNIGTCVTSFIASLSGNRNTKRIVLVHLMFNVVGTGVFVTICTLFPFSEFIASFTPDNVMSQIANVHTIFNISTTLMLLPFGALLVKMTYYILPMKEDEKEDAAELTLLSDQSFGSSLVALTSLKKEVGKMFITTKKSFKLITDVLIDGRKLDIERIERNEKKINRIDFEINKFMSNVNSLSMQEMESDKCNALFRLSVDIERIGDHIENLAGYARMVNLKEIHFDKKISEELGILFERIQLMQDTLLTEDVFENAELFKLILDKEDEIDDYTDEFRKNQIVRLQNKESDASTGVIYSEVLTDLERIADYLMNVAELCNTQDISFNKNN